MSVVGSAATPMAFVYVTDRARALAFYRDTLGLKLKSEDPYGDIFDLGGALMRTTMIPDHQASQHPVVGWNVTGIEAIARTLLDRGVEMTRFPGMPTDDLGVWSSPDGKSKLAFFPDPDGNFVCLSEG